MGNPLSHCLKVTPEDGITPPECQQDPDCPGILACIQNKCLDPCIELKPCSSSTKCSVSNTLPVKTMVCTCPEGWVPDDDGECRPGKPFKFYMIFFNKL
jgi:hypothetical protein